MISYLIKAIACLLILLLAHRLLLQREAMHRFNRFFLLFSVVVSFLIPLLTIEVAQEIVATPVEVNSEPVYFEAASQDYNQEQVFTAVPESQFNWEYLLIGIYGLIVLIFLYRFVRNIKILFNQIQRNIKINYRGQTLVLLKEDSLPFSFLKYIFVAEADLENGKFTDAVFAHECTHIEEKHSWDNLFIEALLVPFWFHPGLHWAKASIKLNHEFIADEVALRSTPLEKYESQLLAMMLSNQKYGLVSSLNFSLTKKRFEMMKKKSMSSQSWIKLLVLVPVVGVLVYFFSEKVAAKVDSDIIGEVYVNASHAVEVDFDLTLELKPNGVYISKGEEYSIEEVKDLIEKTEPVDNHLTINLITGPEVSMGELSDFQAMLRDLDIRRIYYYGAENQESKGGEEDKYQDVTQDQLPKLTAEQIEEKEKYYRNASFFVENEAGDLIAKTYSELSEFEKSHLMPVTEAPSKKQPSSSDFEAWKQADDFALWLDGKVIPNSQLENMSTSDVVFFFNSFVHLNARSERFPQEHQVHLYSNEAYENAYGAKSGKGNLLDKDDKFYIYPKDNRVNFGKPQVKKEKDPVADQKEETSSKWPPAVRANKIQEHLQAYKDAMSIYEELRNQAPHFVKRGKVEQDKLTEMFSDLGSMYSQISFNDKPKFSPPAHPYAPYIKLASKGETYYKLKKDLTAEELSQLPTPPTQREQVVAYKKLFLQYELKRNEGRNDANKSAEERQTMFQMYNELQVKFLAMDAPERRQVKMVNFPYYRVEENGAFVFKAVSELSPEQKALNNC
ncbi:M56 family metallopeptidase [Algoriphagus aquimarinus]|uniref:M56 family metallopeptidase n=1 Tax=Algoriphagus aquimarinus TaxID=237018 RepID=A0A5C7ARM5_9BACT|nr:M56 family metallopeptidase [Algoriphagus aquimarinus]TXE11051.1 M56 family metallopeptidase [Algoriphagus aquimarinus]